MKQLKRLLLATALTAIATTGFARDLVINANTSDPAQKLAMENLINDFEAAYPDVDVKFNLYDHEAFKVAMRNFLTSDAPDLITWNAGNRMKVFVDLGLFEDVSDVWESENLYEKMPAVVGASSVDGKQYGVPYAYYAWGFYYRKDLFEKAGITQTPTNWEEFKTMGEQLKTAGITPVTIGTKNLWPSAGWFDFLNLRINGVDFHAELMDGQVKYTDDRVKKVFATWAELVEGDFFVKNHPAYSFQEALPFMNQGDAAMYLLAPFIVSMFPEDVRKNVEWFPFPIIDESVGIYEDAPTDSFHIPVNAKNKEDARLFLRFVAQADVQTKTAGTLDMLPPNINATVKDDRFAKGGFAQLSRASGIMQFYDRDTDPALAKVGMQGFQEFMQNPDRIDDILARIEAERERIYGAL
ncbi:ABC-type sugar transport system, periplasmic component [Hoeflea phototrophica DFL-43]|uniref:ABC-type sugar transport system, periplasmic component n=1 Tax=Hoeflea phototrophica (strain DSM 17068 / NCIMB 14078 / DFL-43) TaxID=411684 RepID=A9D016_HOEPD|nr:extracellular solute-binding protein [Hoeflea phototrophica]EDQ34902.1 ABC-type sugar transport system, periplasmic component [Hoeflea phototrophica DFL-43]